MKELLKKSESFAHLKGKVSRRQFLAILGSMAAVPLLGTHGRKAFAAPSSKIVMKVSHVLTEHDNVNRAIIRFKETVEKKTHGQLEVQIYPNSALGSLRVTFESMQLGNLV
jgi:TRAP-type C4-dicarboxylate transport system substrate-binding protein